MIGDHWEKDIQGAKNLGIKALWFKPQGDKPKAKAWFRNYHEGDAAGVEKLASLESREVLLAKAVGAVQAFLAKAAYLFAAPAI